MWMTLLIACGAGATKPQLETLSLVVDGHGVRAELADEPSERSLGLMYRKALGTDAGMLFVYPESQERGFWMENTQIPLTIAYITEDGRIATVKDMTPFNRTSVSSDVPVLYALEMIQGWFVDHDVQVGDRVTGLPGASTK